jgi:hypothetical protein
VKERGVGCGEVKGRESNWGEGERGEVDRGRLGWDKVERRA